MAFQRGTTTVAAAQETGAVSTEPLDAGARPFAVPASLRIAPSSLPAAVGGRFASEREIRRHVRLT